MKTFLNKHGQGILAIIIGLGIISLPIILLSVIQTENITEYKIWENVLGITAYTILGFSHTVVSFALGVFFSEKILKGFLSFN